MTLRRSSPPALALAFLAGLAACTPYYARPTDHEQRALVRAQVAKAEGDVAGACSELAAAAVGDVHPSLLIAYARCLMDPAAGTPDLDRARAVLERAYALPSPRRGRAALWLAQLERQRGAPPQAQIVWLERARRLGEPGTERLLVKAWAQEPETYRAQLIDAYERTATTDPYSALELARLVAADPAVDPAIVRTRGLAAVRALEVGARAGNGAQARTLAWLYRSGELVPQDQERAQSWLAVAAKAGDPKAQRKLAERAQAEGDDDTASRWLEQAVGGGDTTAAVALSQGLLSGRYRTVSPEGEDALARLAGSTAPPELALAYGNLLLARSSGRFDPEAGLALLERAAARGHPPAQAELGRRLLRGQSVPSDPDRGLTLLETAADADDAGAMFHLARAYLNGQGIGRDPPLGMDWLRRAAQAGSRGAREELARHTGEAATGPADIASG
ncbi:MAG: tetratricopeptide repeat protein [Geminicoccaceae bacterium]